MVPPQHEHLAGSVARDPLKLTVSSGRQPVGGDRCGHLGGGRWHGAITGECHGGHGPAFVADGEDLVGPTRPVGPGGKGRELLNRDLPTVRFSHRSQAEPSGVAATFFSSTNDPTFQRGVRGKSHMTPCMSPSAIPGLSSAIVHPYFSPARRMAVYWPGNAAHQKPHIVPLTTGPIHVPLRYRPALTA